TARKSATHTCSHAACAVARTARTFGSRATYATIRASSSGTAPASARGTERTRRDLTVDRQRRGIVAQDEIAVPCVAFETYNLPGVPSDRAGRHIHGPNGGRVRRPWRQRIVPPPRTRVAQRTSRTASGGTRGGCERHAGPKSDTSPP